MTATRRNKRQMERTIIKAVDKFETPDHLQGIENKPVEPVFNIPESLTELPVEVGRLNAIGEFIPVITEPEAITGEFIPEFVQRDNCLKAILLKVGKDFDPMYQVGDIVIFKAGSQSTEINGKKHLVFQDFNLVCKYIV